MSTATKNAAKNDVATKNAAKNGNGAKADSTQNMDDVEETGIVKERRPWPAKPTPKKILESEDLVLRFMRGIKSCMDDKELNGEPVRALDAHKASEYTESKFGKKNKWSVTVVAKFLEGIIGDTVPIYKKHRLKWSGDKDFTPTLKKAWNESGGDYAKTCKLLGKTEWGENVMEESAVAFQVKMHTNDDGTMEDGWTKPKEGQKASRGRKKAQLDENLLDEIRNIFAD